MLLVAAWATAVVLVRLPTSPAPSSGSRATPDQTPPPSAYCGTFTASLTITEPDPASGPAGTHLTIVGDGFYGPSQTGYVQIWLATESGDLLGSMAFIPSGTAEPFTIDLDFPATGTEGGLTLGTYYLWGLNDTSPTNCADASFTLTGANPGLACENFSAQLSVVSPTPATGGPGTVVDLQGVGFYNDNLTYIYWAAASGALLTYLLPATTGSSGGWFNASVTVPTGFAVGVYFFWATDGTSDYECAGAMFNLTAGPALALSPTSGAGGTNVTVTGSGFSASDTAVTISGAMLLFPLSCDLSGGSITGSCYFDVDGGLAGAQSVTGVGNVVGGSTDTGVGTFTLYPSLQLSPESGAVGSSFSISGYDFSAYPSAADVTFDGELLTPTGGSDCVSGASDTLITLDDNGQFDCTFTVPTWATAGANPVLGNDTFTSESTAEQTFTVPSSLAITTSSLSGWDVDLPGYSQTLTATGGTVPYTWSATGLPTGLSLNATTGTIAGTPSSSSGSPFDVEVTVEDDAEHTAEATFSVTINPALVITTAGLAGWDAGLPGYSQTVSATGGTAPLLWSASGLPPGLSIGISGGTITGTPSSSAGSPYSVVVSVEDPYGGVAQASYSLSIAPAPAISTTELASWDVGVPGYSQTVDGTGGMAPYAWSATGLPSGLGIGPANGTITGSPSSSAGSPYSVTVTLTDAVGSQAQQVYTLSVNPSPTIATPSLMSWDAGIAGYSQTLSAAGGTAPFTWSATGLPTGLGIDPSTGVISGTPASSSGSPYTVDVTLSDAVGVTAEQTYSLTIYSGLSISTTALASWDVGVAGYDQTLTATGVIGGVAWQSTGLPPGLSLDLATGTIVGTPTTASGSPFTVSVTLQDTAGQEAEQSYSLDILTPLVLSITSTSGASGPVTFSIDGLVPNTVFDVYLDTTPGVASTNPVDDLGSCISTSAGDLIDCTVQIPSGLAPGTYYVDLFQDPSAPPFVLSVFHFTESGPSPQLLGLPILDFELLVGGLVVVGLAIGVVIARRRRRTPRAPASEAPPPPR